MSCNVTSYYVMSCRVVSGYIISYHVISQAGGTAGQSDEALGGTCHIDGDAYACVQGTVQYSHVQMQAVHFVGTASNHSTPTAVFLLEIPEILIESLDES